MGFEKKMKDAYPVFLTAPEYNLKEHETLWSAREMASVALSVERERRIENVFGDVSHVLSVSLAPPGAPLRLSLLHSIVDRRCGTSP